MGKQVCEKQGKTGIQQLVEKHREENAEFRQPGGQQRVRDSNHSFCAGYIPVGKFAPVKEPRAADAVRGLC